MDTIEEKKYESTSKILGWSLLIIGTLIWWLTISTLQSTNDTHDKKTEETHINSRGEIVNISPKRKS